MVGAVSFLALVILVAVAAWFPPDARIQLRFKDIGLEIDGRNETVDESADEAGKPDGEDDIEEEAGVDTEAEGDLVEPDEDDEGDLTANGEQENLFSEAHDHLRRGEYEKGMGIINQEIEREGKVGTERISRIAFARYIAASEGGVDAALRDLKEMAWDTHSGVFPSHFWYGAALRGRNETRESVEELRRALECAGDDSDRSAAYRWIASTYEREDRCEKAIGELEEAVNELEDSTALSRVLKKLAEMYQGQNDDLKAWAVYEQAVSLDPTDNDLRFKIAYRYSESGHQWLALEHYKELLRRSSEHGMAANNAGAVCNKLALDVSAVEYFRRGEDRGIGLAAANLAQRLLDAGFQEEAESKLRKALDRGDDHPNVKKGLANIEDKKQKENNRKKDGARRAREMSEWQKRIAPSYLEDCDTPQALSGEYRNDEVILTLNIEAKNEVDGKLEHGSRTYEVSGQLVGCVLSLSFEENQEDKSGSLLGAFGSAQDKKSGLFIKEEEGVLWGLVADTQHLLSFTDETGINKWRVSRT